MSATWSNRDESHNPRQSVDELIIKDEKKIEVEMEVRRQVDNLMREELDLLKAVRPWRVWRVFIINNIDL